MRTTLTIDDDLAGILRRQARDLDKPFKEMVNTALRKGLAGSSAEKTRQVTVQPHDFGEARPGLDMNRLNQLVDELAVEDYLEKAAKDDSARAFAWPWKGLGN
jgi:hypothetical protein